MDQPLLEEPAGSQGCFLHSIIMSLFPVLTWLPRYKLRWLKMDLLAGLTVGLTTVPQALAYAEVAGLPVQVCVSLSLSLFLIDLLLTYCRYFLHNNVLHNKFLFLKVLYFFHNLLFQDFFKNRICIYSLPKNETM